MTIYDISVPISDRTPVYPGDPRPEVKALYSISEGNLANVSMLTLASHTGTHIDPPYHLIEDGATMDQIPLDLLIGECFVCQMENVDVITADDLESAGIPEGTERVLFRTRNSQLWNQPEFDPNYVYLDVSASEWLLSHGVKVVGVDYLSVDSPLDSTFPVHTRLLKHDIIVIECLDLSRVERGRYTLVCLPLKATGGDGGLARAVLMR